ncbi:MAG TPA: hypothetical protein VFC63_16300 [Blastocatellia bacterium]|nr:hypothetical protein [Blastocatellia bacterium]
MSKNEIATINPAATDHQSFTELLFPGTQFGLEKSAAVVLLGGSYLLFGVLSLLTSAHYLTAIYATIVFVALGTGILAKLRGRWLALFTFSVMVILSVRHQGIGNVDRFTFWLAVVVYCSAEIAGFNLLIGFLRWCQSSPEASQEA